MYADMQKCHKAAHKNIKTGSGILTVDEAKILLKSHPEYILPQDSRMIHLLQNHTTGGHLIIISVPFTESDFQRRM